VEKRHLCNGYIGDADVAPGLEKLRSNRQTIEILISKEEKPLT